MEITYNSRLWARTEFLVIAKKKYSCSFLFDYKQNDEGTTLASQFSIIIDQRKIIHS